jgi:hypothetical protein
LIAPLLAATLLAVGGCNPFEMPNRVGPKVAETKLEKAPAEFTGKVVLVAEGYRLRLLDSEETVRLTRAKRSTEFEHEELNLRKYYEKTLVVRGTKQDEWIWAAEVVGQWLRPGEHRGSNMLAPPVNEQ